MGGGQRGGAVNKTGKAVHGVQNAGRGGCKTQRSVAFGDGKKDVKGVGDRTSPARKKQNLVVPFGGLEMKRGNRRSKQTQGGGGKGVDRLEPSRKRCIGGKILLGHSQRNKEAGGRL